MIRSKSKLLLTAVSFSALLNTSAANAGIFSIFQKTVHNPLVEAAELGNDGYIKTLLSKGFPVNAVDAKGNTALLRASYHGNTKAVEALVKGGADVNAVDKYGRTALHWAAKNNFSDIAKVLVQAGADTTIMDKNGQTPFQTAIAEQNVGVASVIDPTALKAVQTEAAFPAVVAAAAAVGGGGISTTTVMVAGGVAAAGAGVAVAAGGGGGGGGGESSSGGDSGGSGGGSGGGSSGGGSGGGSSGGSSGPTLGNPGSFETPEYHNSRPDYNSNGLVVTNGLGAIKASHAYAENHNGQNIIVAVLDTGVDLAHPDLAANVLTNIDRDFVNNDTIAQDDDGHGTHVAGIIAGVMGNQVFFSNGQETNLNMHGVAYGAKILPVKVMDENGSGHSSDIADGITYAVNNGAKVINLSLGADGTSIIGADPFSTDITPAIKNAMQAGSGIQKGALIFAAAGNQPGGTDPIWPARNAAFLNGNGTGGTVATGAIIAVVSVDANKELSSFSNSCGIAMYWCLATPGESIHSTYWDNGHSYAVISGTSMATPFASGAAAVLLEAFPSLSSRDVAEILLVTADRISDPTATTIVNKPGQIDDGVNSTYGWGMLNLDAAMSPVGDPVIPLSNNVTGISFSLVSSNITMASAFGDALDNSALQFAMLDGYNRAYDVSIASLVTPASSNFDDMIDSFGSANLANKIQISENMSFAFDDTAKNLPNTPEEDIKRHSRMSFHTASENSSMDVNYNIPMDMAFAPAVLKGVSGSATEGIDRTSFLSFATEGMSYLSEFNVDKTTRMRTGSFYGDQENGAVFGFVNDITHRFDHANVGVQFGMINEENTFLGSESGGAFALNKNTPTWFYNLSADVPLADKYSLYGSYNYGVSFPEASSESLFRDISEIQSYSFKVGVNKKDSFKDGDKIDFTLSQPLMVSGGSANLDLPMGRDVDGNIARGLYGVNLTPTGRELDIGAFYSFDTAKNSTISTGAIYRMQPNHVEDAEADQVFLVKYRLRY